MAATVHIVLSAVPNRDRTVGVFTVPMPVALSVPLFSDTKTSSGTSAQSDITAPDANSFWSVTVTGGNVFVKFGSNPTAASDDGWLILDGQTRDFAVSAASEKVAIKDA